MDRWQWIDAFRKANIEPATVMNLNEKDFKNICAYLVDCGIAPLKYYQEQNGLINKEEDELDKVIREANLIKAKNENSQSYRYNKESTHNIYEKDDNSHKTSQNNSGDTSLKSSPNCYVWNPDNVNENEQILDKQFEKEYQEALNDALQQQKEKREAEIQQMKENLQKNNESNLITQRKRDNIEKYQMMPKEPEDGIQFAILMPDGERIIRKFNLNDLADDIFTIVEGHEIMYNPQSNELLPYKIKYGLNEELKRGLSLGEQNLKKKTQFLVILT